MNKKEALKELDLIESRQKELRRIIEEADKPKTIFERVFDIPSAITELGESHEAVKEYRILQKAGASIKNLRAQEIEIFCKAMNEGVVMSWKNTNQKKHYIWFDFENAVGSGFVLNFVYYYFHYCHYISARHTYESEAKARHGAKCIEQTYYDYLVD